MCVEFRLLCQTCSVPYQQPWCFSKFNSFPLPVRESWGTRFPSLCSAAHLWAHFSGLPLLCSSSYCLSCLLMKEKLLPGTTEVVWVLCSDCFSVVCLNVTSVGEAWHHGAATALEPGGFTDSGETFLPLPQRFWRVFIDNLCSMLFVCETVTEKGFWKSMRGIQSTREGREALQVSVMAGWIQASAWSPEFPALKGFIYCKSWRRECQVMLIEACSVLPDLSLAACLNKHPLHQSHHSLSYASELCWFSPWWCKTGNEFKIFIEWQLQSYPLWSDERTAGPQRHHSICHLAMCKVARGCRVPVMFIRSPW